MLKQFRRVSTANRKSLHFLITVHQLYLSRNFRTKKNKILFQYHFFYKSHVFKKRFIHNKNLLINIKEHNDNSNCLQNENNFQACNENDLNSSPINDTKIYEQFVACSCNFFHTFYDANAIKISITLSSRKGSKPKSVTV